MYITATCLETNAIVMGIKNKHYLNIQKTEMKATKEFTQ